MTLSDLYVLIRAETGHDTDAQIDDEDHLNPWIRIAYEQLRRKLSAKFRHLFIATSATTTLTGSSTTVTKPSDFESLERLERLEGDRWVAVPKASGFVPELDVYRGYREQGASFLISPTDAAAGSYRLVYLRGPANCIPDGSIPKGFIDIVIQEVVAKVQIRTGGDPKPHREEAKRIWAEQSKALSASRLAAQGPEPGFVSYHGDN